MEQEKSSDNIVERMSLDLLRVHEIQQFIEQAVALDKMYEVMIYSLYYMKQNPSLDPQEAFIAGFNKAID